MPNKKGLPIDAESKEAKNEAAPTPDDAPVTAQTNFTDARVEPINVQPGDPEKAETEQEETNEARGEKTREEFFRELTQRNPTSKLNEFIQRSDVAGLPGNNKPIPGADSVPTQEAKKKEAKEEE